jgi:predicted ArsR family transcriptional regulator
MQSALNENPSREKMLLLLKRKGVLSIDQLSREMNITSMGIRQHLLSLERKGLIEYIIKRQGIGRPAFLYRLTQKADDLFPKSYDKFIVDLLTDVEKHDGRGKIEEIFKWRKAKFLKEAKELLESKKTIRDKVYGLRDFLESEGYFAELSDSDGHYNLSLFNCPIPKVAAVFEEACRYDLQAFRDLLGKEVRQPECMANGNPSCIFIIPKPAQKH